jgi:hemoglobin
MQENEVYQALGEQGFARLVHEFYSQVPHDDILGPLYPEQDFEGAERRLRIS